MRDSKQRKGLCKANFEKRLQKYTAKSREDQKADGGWQYGNQKHIYEMVGGRKIFLLPNAIFTLGLSPGEMTLYAYLIFCEDRKTHQCWPSIGRISQHTGMSANTITKYIRQLEEKQLIDVESTKVRTKRGEVRNGTLQFTIRPIQDAVNYKLENDLSTLPDPKRTRKRR